MSCAQAEELLGAYAVDALPDDEAAEFRAHIAGCAEHAAMAAELRAVASALATDVAAAQPPSNLRARVLTAVAREPQESTLALPRRIDTAPSGRQQPGAPFWRSVRPLQAWGALAAAIIAGLVVWNVALQSEGDDDRFDATNATVISALQANGVSGAGSALYFDDEDAIVLVADGIDQLDASQTYQLWALTEGDPVSLGVMRPDAAGRMESVVPFEIADASAIAITIEPAGGSAQPTSDPVFTAALRS
jgi:anti-sigma-K factor RskA